MPVDGYPIKNSVFAAILCLLVLLFSFGAYYKREQTPCQTKSLHIIVELKSDESIFDAYVEGNHLNLKVWKSNGMSRLVRKHLSSGDSEVCIVYPEKNN